MPPPPVSCNISPHITSNSYGNQHLLAGNSEIRTEYSETSPTDTSSTLTNSQMLVPLIPSAITQPVSSTVNLLLLSQAAEEPTPKTEQTESEPNQVNDSTINNNLYKSDRIYPPPLTLIGPNSNSNMSEDQYLGSRGNWPLLPESSAFQNNAWHPAVREHTSPHNMTPWPNTRPPNLVELHSVNNNERMGEEIGQKYEMDMSSLGMQHHISGTDHNFGDISTAVGAAITGHSHINHHPKPSFATHQPFYSWY